MASNAVLRRPEAQPGTSEIGLDGLINVGAGSGVVYVFENHLLLWPHEDGDLRRWLQWLMTSHVRRYHRHYKGSGHVWQGRFKAFPVQSDEHYLTVLRYVERNPLRANMVQRSQDCELSSLKPTTQSGPAGNRYRAEGRASEPCSRHSVW